MGQSVYLLQAVKTLIGYSPFYSKLIIDGNEVFNGYVFEVIIAKSKYYAGTFALFKDASLSNGFFDIAVFTHPSKLSFSIGCLRFFMGINDVHRHLYRGKNIIVQTSDPVPVQFDGDRADTTPSKFRLIPATLEVIVPGV